MAEKKEKTENTEVQVGDQGVDSEKAAAIDELVSACINDYERLGGKGVGLTAETIFSPAEIGASVEKIDYLVDYFSPELPTDKLENGIRAISLSASDEAVNKFAEAVCNSVSSFPRDIVTSLQNEIRNYISSPKDPRIIWAIERVSEAILKRLITVPNVDKETILEITGLLRRCLTEEEVNLFVRSRCLTGSFSEAREAAGERGLTVQEIKLLTKKINEKLNPSEPSVEDLHLGVG